MIYRFISIIAHGRDLGCEIIYTMCASRCVMFDD